MQCATTATGHPVANCYRCGCLLFGTVCLLQSTWETRILGRFGRFHCETGILQRHVWSGRKTDSYCLIPSMPSSWHHLPILLVPIVLHRSFWYLNMGWLIHWGLTSQSNYSYESHCKVWVWIILPTWGLLNVHRNPDTWHQRFNVSHEKQHV